MANSKPQSHIPILNPRDVPSVRYTDTQVRAEWTPSQWQQLERQFIATALTQAEGVEGLLRQDAIKHEQLRDAAVLMLLIEQSGAEGGWSLVLTTRAQHLRHHPGQVSFVGGGVEEGERVIEAALREAAEEINLDVQAVEILGVLPDYHTITGFRVAPVLGVMHGADWRKQNIVIDRDEVDEVFTVPLKHIFDDSQIRRHTFEYQNHQRNFLSVTYLADHAQTISLKHQEIKESADSIDSQEYFIWGASMAMLNNLNQILRAHLSAQ